MERLPIDDALPELTAAFRRARGVVLEAPPGAGKTTRVPGALLDAGLAGDREVVVLEPRRLAARLAARRVADERGERLGEGVGYQVRFEEVASARTRIRFVTEGVLTRRLLSDPTLARVGAVLLDEFHERHLQGDVALAMLRQLQRTSRPDLLVGVMSATLDPGPVARFLGEGGEEAPRVRSEGRRFDVAIEHLPRPDDRPLATLVAEAVGRLAREGLDGDVLVFLPGAAEIRKAMAACEPAAARHDLLVLPLHGDLPPAEQDRAIARAPRRKVIVSTNVAETSVTIDGVVAVVDGGLARVASHAAWSGLPVLKVARVSRASAAQRAGRAGRTRPGRCLRLYTKHDHDTRPEHDAPEVARLDLAETLLELHAGGVRDPRAFGWFEAPGAASLDAAEELLRALDAVAPDGALTARGRRMLRYPLHPRLSRVLVEAVDRGAAEAGCALAAVLGERELVAARRGAGLGRGGGGASPGESRGDSDVTAAVARYEEARAYDLHPESVRSLGLDVGALQAVDRVRKQLERAVARDRAEPAAPLLAPGDGDEVLRVALLAGYPDRVARRIRGTEFTLVGGGTAALSESSEVRDAEFVLAVDAEERLDGPRRGAVIRTASAVEPEWLLELFPDAIREATEARWNAADERADVVARMYYRALVIDESRAPRTEAAARAAAACLADAAAAKGPRAFARDPDALDRLLARVAFLAQHMPELRLPALTEADAVATLRALCEGRRSFDELRAAGLVEALADRLDAAQRRALDAHAPERVQLPGGRGVKVNYEPARPPWVESRLQDFFGMAQGPSVAAGRVHLVLHLLAPNHRAVQVTTDLAGFWARHYPGIRKELCRKYPRHPWPEDGRTATPPEPRRR
ncbi:MAG: ATP-dependent helicase HrpB [Polyangiales bacterium]